MQLSEGLSFPRSNQLSSVTPVAIHSAAPQERTRQSRVGLVSKLAIRTV